MECYKASEMNHLATFPNHMKPGTEPHFISIIHTIENCGCSIMVWKLVPKKEENNGSKAQHLTNYLRHQVNTSVVFGKFYEIHSVTQPDFWPATNIPFIISHHRRTLNGCVLRLRSSLDKTLKRLIPNLPKHPVLSIIGGVIINVSFIHDNMKGCYPTHCRRTTWNMQQLQALWEHQNVVDKQVSDSVSVYSLEYTARYVISEQLLNFSFCTDTNLQWTNNAAF